MVRKKTVKRVLFLKNPRDDLKSDPCPICNYEHNPKDPHNATDLYYREKFFKKYKRWPSWMDAMSHCSDSIKARYIRELESVGIDVASTHGFMPKEDL